MAGATPTVTVASVIRAATRPSAFTSATGRSRSSAACSRLGRAGVHDGVERAFTIAWSAHVGALVIRGTYSSGLTFEHADGRPYGSPAVSPAKASALATALELHVGLGFKHREAQSMIDRIRTHVGPQ